VILSDTGRSATIDVGGVVLTPGAHWSHVVDALVSSLADGLYRQVGVETGADDAWSMMGPSSLYRFGVLVVPEVCRFRQ
jgi:hypothetical protein